MKIGDWAGYDSSEAEGLGMLDFAPCCALRADKSGNLYAIWVLNKRLEQKYPDGRIDHRICLRTRHHGQWGDEVCVSEGRGLVRSPNLMVGDNGDVHVTYLKHIGGKRFGAFYRRVVLENKG